MPPLLVADAGIIGTLSQLGVILLMFYIGMELSLRKLAEVGPRGFAVVLVELGLMLSLGYVISAAGAWMFLGEVIPPQRLLAIGVIMLGVILLART